MICQEEGCHNTDVIECELTIHKGDLPLLSYLKTYGLIETVRISYELFKYGYANTYDYYCAEHCQKNGYCYGCGHFWAGSESFDFGNGLCSNCHGDLEEWDFDDGEAEDYFEMPDEYYSEQEYPE